MVEPAKAAHNALRTRVQNDGRLTGARQANDVRRLSDNSGAGAMCANGLVSTPLWVATAEWVQKVGDRLEAIRFAIFAVN